jgi:exonuclease III
VNYNVRGINTEEKQQKVYQILGKYRPQVVCLNETKLQSPLFLDRYWSF